MVNTIITIIFSIVGLIFIFVLMGLVSNISNYFDAKSKLANLDYSIKLSDNPTSNLQERVHVTTELLNCINALIDNEIGRIFQSYLVLRKKYEVLKMDEDIKIISEAVFNAIKKEIITDKDLVFTENYVMSFIAQSTAVKLIVYAQAYNTTIIQPK